MKDIVGSLASFISKHATIEQINEMLLASQANEFSAVCLCLDKGITIDELTTSLKLALSHRGA